MPALCIQCQDFACSVTTYVSQLLVLCIHCIGTASTFQDNAGVIASNAETLHPAEVALKAYCHHCRLTASTFLGTDSSVKTYCIQLVRHCRHCMGTAYTFRETVGGTATNAGSLHPSSWALHPLSYHTACTLWDTASTAWALHPCSWTLHLAVQPLQQNCILVKWHCRCTAITAGSLYPPSWALPPPSDNTTSTLWDTLSTAWALHPQSRTMQRHCNHCRDTDFS